jgi:hypothetical protein
VDLFLRQFPLLGGITQLLQALVELGDDVVGQMAQILAQLLRPALQLQRFPAEAGDLLLVLADPVLELPDVPLEALDILDHVLQARAQLLELVQAGAQIGAAARQFLVQGALPFPVGLDLPLHRAGPLL